MKIEEVRKAIEYIKHVKKLHHDFLSGDCRKSLNIAIESLEKQMPKKVIEANKYQDACPSCGYLIHVDSKFNYCPICGQCLDYENWKCDSYYIDKYGTSRCVGSKWVQECKCEGDESKCDFYEHKRNKGVKKK